MNSIKNTSVGSLISYVRMQSMMQSSSRFLSLEPFNYTTPKYKSFLNHNDFYPHFYVYMQA